MATSAPRHGMFVPEKAPPEVVNKLYTAVSGIMNDPDVQKKLADQCIKATASNSPGRLLQLRRC